MNLSRIRQLLELYQIRPTKSRGQNFLHDTNQLQKIVNAAAISSEDKILEIGPGFGSLTQLLLSKASLVITIECDDKLVLALQDLFHCRAIKPESFPHIAPELNLSSIDDQRLVLIHGDALAFFKNPMHDLRTWKIVSNLPFSIASPLLVELARGSRSPDRITVTVQLEVAQRIVAKPKLEQYGILTVLLGVDFESKVAFRIPPSCFYPEPEVTSACVILTRRTHQLIPDRLRPLFKQIVKQAFSQRRKKMFKLLSQIWPEDIVKSAFSSVKIPEDARAEQISIEEFAALTHEIDKLGRIIQDYGIRSVDSGK